MKNKKINHALIMAAGRGLRMKPLTNKIPKAMAPYLQSTLISETLKNFKRKINNLHITVGYKGPILAKHVLESGASSVLNTNGKGNSWWLYNTLLKYLNEPVFVMTCDNIFDTNLDKFEQEYYEKNCPACMIIPTKPKKGFDGDYIKHDRKFKILEISRKKKYNKLCSGLQIINPSKINFLTKKRSSFYQIWNQLIQLDEIYCSKKLLNNWYAVDDINQLKIVNKIY